MNELFGLLLEIGRLLLAKEYEAAERKTLALGQAIALKRLTREAAK